MQWAEGRVGAARDIAPLIAALPAEHVARQVARLTQLHGMDHATVTTEVTDALTRGDAWDRLQMHETRRSGASDGLPVNAGARAAQDFPALLPSVRLAATSATASSWRPGPAIETERSSSR